MSRLFHGRVWIPASHFNSLTELKFNILWHPMRIHFDKEPLQMFKEA